MAGARTPNTIRDSGADLAASCPSRKRCFPSRTAATRAMKSTLRAEHAPKSTRRADPMNAYHCNVCDFWHIGHTSHLTKASA